MAQALTAGLARAGCGVLMPVVAIHALDQEGRGVARVDGKVTFVEGALPGEVAEIDVRQRKRSFDVANVTGLLGESSQRVAPRCPHYRRCGGCSLQHLEPRAQVAMKQRILEDDLARIGKVRPDVMLPAIHGPAWRYRRRARMSAKYVAGKGGSLIGFRERRAHFITDMDSCAVLPDRISALIGPMRELVSRLTLADRIPQVEIAATDDADALTFRVLDRPTPEDIEQLRAFAHRHQVIVQLQSGGPDSVRTLDGGTYVPLRYRLPEFDLEFEFTTAEFTQVNAEVNRTLVSRAIRMLRPGPGQRIADLFCGLGNFTLPIARRGARVTGVEGNHGLVARAVANAARNGLSGLAEFRVGDLFLDPRSILSELGPLDAMLVDPPRDGAHALVQALDSGPRRLVYVSCNPATLARDAGVLVHEKGYRLAAAGVVNMFPHTSHVESTALFERQD